MFMRFVRGIYNRARETELEQVVDTEYLPALEQLPGFRSFHSGHQDGRFAAVIYFDTAEQAETAGRLRAPLEAVGLHVESVDGFGIDRHL